MSKLVKNNIKLFIGIIIGGILFGGATYVVATSIASSNITYTGNGQTTVQGALDDLYGKANNLNYKYWRSTTTYLSWNAPSNVKSNYTSVVTANNTSTLMRTVYSNGKPVAHGVCLYYGTTNKIFCLDYGYWPSIVKSKSASETNGATVKDELQPAMASALGVSTSSLTCYSVDENAFCIIGSARCVAFNTGSVYCTDGSSNCTVDIDGNAYCE